MPSYAVQFNTDAETATDSVEAKTPEQALAIAHDLLLAGGEDLVFENYSEPHPVNQIVVENEWGAEL